MGHGECWVQRSLRGFVVSSSAWTALLGLLFVLDLEMAPVLIRGRACLSFLWKLGQSLALLLPELQEKQSAVHRSQTDKSGRGVFQASLGSGLPSGQTRLEELGQSLTRVLPDLQEKQSALHRSQTDGG